MKMKILFVLLIAAVPAFAQTQSEMNAEAARDFAKADAKLNAAYARVKAALDEEGVQKLKAAQRAWVTFRDAEAALVADQNRGGSIAPLEYDTTRQSLTEDRTKQLQALLTEQ